MGQKSSKQAGQWPPYAYQGSQFGQAAPFFPPGFQPPPGQQYSGMGGPVIPHMYPGMPGSQMPFIPPSPEKGFFGRKKKRSQSEHYPGGYMPFPQPQYAPPPNTIPAVPEAPSRSKTRKKAPPTIRMPDAMSAPADSSFGPTHRSATPFGQPPPLDDSDDTSEDEDEDDYRRRRSRRASHRRRTRSEEFLPATNAPLRNPLPPPPKDLYEMTPYKSLLALPQSTALLNAISSTRNPQAAATVTHPPAVLQQIPVAQPQTQQPTPPQSEQLTKKKSLFRRLTSSKRKHERQESQAQPVAAAAQAPIILPIGTNPTQFLPAMISKQPSLHPIVSGGSQPRPSTSSASAPPPVPSSQAPPDSADFRADTAGYSDAGFTSAGLATGGMASGGFPTGSSGGFGGGSNAWIPAPPQSPVPDPDRNANPHAPYYFSQDDPKFAPFMNHSPHRVIYRNAIYATATHVHEAMKYIDHRPDLAESIRRCPDVLYVYPMSASFHEHQRPDWGQVFLEKMEEVLVLKFSQHDNLGKELIGTYPRPLIYADERDTYWGQGPDGSGENQLGRLLMQVREKLMRDPDFRDWMERHDIRPIA